MWVSGQVAPDISPAFADTLGTVLGVEVRELTGPTAALVDGWAALRSGERIASVFDKFDEARGPPHLAAHLSRTHTRSLARSIHLGPHLPIHVDSMEDPTSNHDMC